MNNNRKLTGAVTFVALLAILNVFLTLSLNNSYAADPVTDTVGFPDVGFSPEQNSVATVNYISDAYNDENNGIKESDNNARAIYLDAFNVNNNDYNGVVLYSLMKNAQTPVSSEIFGPDDNNTNPIDITDKGILYILSHGYNYKTVKNNVFTSYSGLKNIQKQYVTQIALWLYIYKKNLTNICDPFEHCNFYYTSTDSDSQPPTATPIELDAIESLIGDCANVNGYEYLNAILDLVSGAERYNRVLASNVTLNTVDSYTFNDSFTSLSTGYITPTIDPVNNPNFLYYKVELINPNNYSVSLIDEAGSAINSGSQVTKFKIIVNDTNKFNDIDLSSVGVKVSAYFIKDNLGKAYHVTDTTRTDEVWENKGVMVRKGVTGQKVDRFANVLFGYLPSESTNATINLPNFTKISKVKITNGSELPGAKLTIDGEGQHLEWTSTDKPHYLFLESGHYTLCETTPPDGYKKAECIQFEVKDNKVTSVEMIDEPLNIPDTAAFSNKLFKVIGILFLVIGIGGLGIVYMKKYKKKSSVN